MRLIHCPMFYLIGISLFLFACTDSPNKDEIYEYKIDGTSVKSFRMSTSIIAEGLQDSPDSLYAFTTGLLAAKYNAFNVIGGIKGIENLKNEISNMSKRDIDIEGERLNMKQESIEASILDGMTVSQVIQYGVNYEKQEGVDLLPGDN